MNALRTADVWLAVAVDTCKTHGREELTAFRTAIRARGRWPVATVSLAAASAAAFWWMRSRGLAESEPGALLRWGASFGPRTSNGEWWRLGAAIFVHPTLMSLLVDVAAFAQAGWILERAAGRAAVVEAFLGGGLFTGLAGLWLHPTGVITSATGAVAGVYGLLAIVAVCGWRRQSAITIPVAMFERLLPLAVILLFHAMADASAGGAAPLAGFAAGSFVGLVALRGLRERTPPAGRMALCAAGATIVAISCAVLLQGILDVRPEIERVVQLEGRTEAAYLDAAARFQGGRMTADDLARLIDRDIAPAFQAEDAHVTALHGVPTDDAPRLAEARAYLHLRTTSWQMRAESVRMADRSMRGVSRREEDTDVAFRVRAQTLYQSALLAAGKADGAERASLEAFARLSPASIP
jgi:rhomboid protease GluP